jgi:hypothetical protein
VDDISHLDLAVRRQTTDSKGIRRSATRLDISPDVSAQDAGINKAIVKRAMK